jgi:hypothetical protein
MTEVSTGGSALALVGQIARILNSGLAPDEPPLAAATISAHGVRAVIAMASGGQWVDVHRGLARHRRVRRASLDELPP